MTITRTKDNGGNTVGTKRNVALPKGSKELHRVLQETNTDDPDPADRKALRKALNEHPDLWRRVADLAEITEEQVVSQVARGNALMTESLRHGLQEMKSELGYEKAPALERLLIEQVTLCWAHFHRIQRHYASFTDGKYVIKEAEHLEKRVNAAQRRLLRAIKTLGRVRKMAGRKPLQINIADKQVNVAG